MSIGNRLSAAQLAALVPGDTVTIETTYGDRRPRLSTGTVARVNPAELTVSVTGPRGGRFIERYSRHSGVRVSHGGRAELVNVEPVDRAAQEVLRQRTQIDLLYREWSQRRGDVEAARQLHNAIEVYLRGIAAHSP